MNCALLTEKERKLFVDTVGIRYRRVAPPNTTASDLCLAAAEKLLSDLKWKKDEINALVFITQTPDYLIPNTASLLQHKLKLSKSVLVFDVNLGCSGYVYGLSIVSSLLQNMKGGKALLLVGDVSTHVISNQDKSTVPLFSDAGSATALEYRGGSLMHFNLQTDGSEYDNIIVPDGGFRSRVSESSFIKREIDTGIIRSNIDMKLDGLKIFNFSLREVLPNIQQLLEISKVELSTVDAFIFHQANKLMLESIRKKLHLQSERVPYSLFDYGNTSSASIPVTLLSQMQNQISTIPMKLLLSGFGVGLSWGSCLIETDNLVCTKIIEV